MTDELQILCLITAENCGHCKNMRKSTLETKDMGGTIQGGHSWSEPFFKKLIFGVNDLSMIANPHYKVYNLHVASMNNLNLNDAILLEFESDGNGVKVSKHLKKDVLSRIPESIKSFIYMYPTFAVFDRKKWDLDILNGTSTLYGRVMNKKTGPIMFMGNVVYGILREGNTMDRSLGSNPVDFAKTIKDNSDKPIKDIEMVPKIKLQPETSIAPGLNDQERNNHKNNTIRKGIGVALKDDEMIVNI